MYRASLTHKAMRRTRIGARDGVVDGEDDGSLIHCPHLSRPTIQSVHSTMRVDSKRRMLNAFGDAGGASSESPRKRFISERVHCYEISSGQINPRPLRSIPPEVSPVDMSADRNIEAASNFSKESIVPMGGHSFSSIDGKSSSISNNNENGILALIPIEHNSAGHRFDSDESPSEVNTPAGDTKTRAALRDKLRRAKISEAIKAFENSMPFSEKRCQESVLDDVIDYIKFLKLQLKVLSQSRLGGEAETFPFVQLEGYGHYLLHPQMSSEPLEEVMGQMLETDMQAANELLESKGLTILPCDLAYALL
ncbi:Myc-type basic helix-loop-helix (bHLH) domain-containing protein [Dioscorea alata]|uniref:Myc-type basic helix-loop-helix (BHLH) domain-containing protein n=1 Tax=Dioscorea alata TaxID=55571 RepID=A0ACB7VRB2_DIOAL|nr:Myc-type basic helix-loop-helix (bHLH) domain-containing protein [Dioscorea alata]